jgi:hypothetical protein
MDPTTDQTVQEAYKTALKNNPNALTSYEAQVATITDAAEKTSAQTIVDEIKIKPISAPVI